VSLVSSWDVLGPTGLFEDVIFYQPAKERLLGWRAWVGVAREIRRRDPDTVFYFRDERWPYLGRDRWFFQAVCGIAHFHGTVAWHGRERQDRRLRLPSEVDRLLEIVSLAGMAVPDRGTASFDLAAAAADRQAVDQLWREARLDDAASIVAFAPGSKMPAKEWPIERYEAVARWVLQTDPRAHVLVLGGMDDVAHGRRLSEAAGARTINAAGRLSVLATAHALARCDAYVGNDSGVMHLAAAAGVPCVAIFSARDNPGRWEPYGRGHVVLRTNPSCAGCMLQVCVEQRMRCLREIEAAAAIDALATVLARRSARVAEAQRA
jgi:ADP-heptose:LPS heptosyltransferase